MKKHKKKEKTVPAWVWVVSIANISMGLFMIHPGLFVVVFGAMLFYFKYE